MVKTTRVSFHLSQTLKFYHPLISQRQVPFISTFHIHAARHRSLAQAHPPLKTILFCVVRIAGTGRWAQPHPASLCPASKNSNAQQRRARPATQYCRTLPRSRDNKHISGSSCRASVATGREVGCVFCFGLGPGGVHATPKKRKRGADAGLAASAPRSAFFNTQERSASLGFRCCGAPLTQQPPLNDPSTLRQPSLLPNKQQR